MANIEITFIDSAACEERSRQRTENRLRRQRAPLKGAWRTDPVRVPKILTKSFPEILTTYPVRESSEIRLPTRERMIDMLKRHEIQVLRRADHTWSEIASLSGVSEKTARRIAAEDPITNVDNTAERARRQVGRPSKAEAYRDVLVQALLEDASLRSVELLHRARQAGYTGGKSALYALAQALRVRTVAPLVRFEGLPGEFSQHDFGEVWTRVASSDRNCLLA